MRPRHLVAAVAAWCAPASALAHGTGPPLLPGWSFEPWALLPIATAAALFAVGQTRLARRSGGGRPALRRRSGLFWLGLAVLAGAVVSPLHAAGARSFTAHMVEHELIMLAAAPLLVWSMPLPVMLWAFPAAARRGLGGLARGLAASPPWRAVTAPAAATALQATALWVWHLPGPFDLALGSEAWHAAQHLCFFGTALAFWSAMIGPRRDPWTAAACLFATSMITGALGALMAVSPSPWYAAYARLGLAAFGLTPAQDQQLAGVIMWAPGGLVHAVAALAILAPRLRSSSGPADA
jgi:cytochrome c oxidase assembly factor CtaG